MCCFNVPGILEFCVDITAFMQEGMNDNQQEEKHVEGESTSSDYRNPRSRCTEEQHYRNNTEQDLPGHKAKDFHKIKDV